MAFKINICTIVKVPFRGPDKMYHDTRMILVKLFIQVGGTGFHFP